MMYVDYSCLICGHREFAKLSRVKPRCRKCGSEEIYRESISREVRLYRMKLTNEDF